jgi:8-oxo-dGTP diphosphatase
LEVLLIHRPRYGDWSWPKGKVEPGEHPVACAVRETAEETGQQVILGVPLPSLRYRIGGRRRKYVYYWAARQATERDAAPVRARPRFRPAERSEIDQAKWFEAGRARRRLSRRSDRRPLDALVGRWRAGALGTRAVIVLRHANAVKRESWDGKEETRPLTEAGRARAEGTVALLAAFGVADLRTSPWRRCRASLRAYARAAHLDRLDVPEIAEAAARQDPLGATEAMRRVLEADRSVAICSHRPVLPLLFGAVRSAAAPGRRIRRAIPRVDPYLRTGELLIAHVCEQPGPTSGSSIRRVVAVERHRAGRADPRDLFVQE